MKKSDKNELVKCTNLVLIITINVFRKVNYSESSVKIISQED